MRSKRYYDGPVSDHYDGLRFFNPGQAEPDRTLWDVLRWKLTSSAARWPARVSVTPARPESRVAGLRVTVVGHMTALIQAPRLNILTDPVWSERASPIGFAGPKRVTAPGIAFDELPPINAVLISHNHYDHLDIETLRRLVNVHDPLLIVPLGNDAIVSRAVPGARLVAADWYDRHHLPQDATVTLTPAHHWSARATGDRRMALWCGFYIDTPCGSIWFAGDTGYGDGAIFCDIRRRCGAPDAALIPIGAYEPRWFMAAQHVNPAEAVQIMRDVGAARALGLHWGTFQFTDEAREAPVMELQKALGAARLPAEVFVAAAPGSVFDIR